MDEIDATKVDAGEQCPCCGSQVKAREEQAFGFALFICPRCHEAWFNLAKEAA